jgi:excisionase family DNA binding protein
MAVEFKQSTEPPPTDDRAAGPVTRATSDIEWVTIPTLAKRLGLASESIYRLARSGQLRCAVKMGRRYVVNYSAFVETSKEPINAAALRS